MHVNLFLGDLGGPLRLLRLKGCDEQNNAEDAEGRRDRRDCI